MNYWSMLMSSLAVLFISWFSPGCGGGDENREIIVNFPAPVSDSMAATNTLWLYAITSGGDEANCQNLMNGTYHPGEGAYQVKDHESVSTPFTAKLRPLKVPKNHTGKLLFFSQGEDLNGKAIFRGCTDDSANPIVITLTAVPPADVTNLVATAGSGQVVLTWQDPSDADFSDVQTTWSPDGSAVQSVAKGTQTYTALGLTNDTEYTFTVKALYSNNKVSEGATVKATPHLITDVYVAGHEDNGTKPVAKVWKNGTATALTDGTKDANAYSVFVSGTDVYVAGYESNGTKEVAKVWKNGAATALTDGSQYAQASSVFVSGSDVYVAGRESNGTKTVAKVWKNGAATALTDGSQYAYANSVFVYGNDVYVAGFEDNGTKPVAKVWKNGTATALTDGTYSAIANSVFVSSNDVYVAGYDNYKAMVWKNGTATSLTDGTYSAIANSVFVSGNDIYVAGREWNGTADIAKFWKNGTATALTDGSHNAAEAYSIFVSGNDVYAAGYDYGYSIAMVWKNGTATALTDEVNFAEARSVFVIVH